MHLIIRVDDSHEDYAVYVISYAYSTYTYPTRCEWWTLACKANKVSVR